MKYVVRKVITLIIALVVISIITFVCFSLIPGDAALAKLGTDATAESLAALRAQMGLDRPVIIRYFSWLTAALAGDFGESLQYTGTSVVKLLSQRLPYSIVLTVISMIMIIAASLPLGILGAERTIKQGGAVFKNVVNVGMSIPAFFLGIIITFVFGMGLKLFQVGLCPELEKDPFGAVIYLIFPALAIAIPKIAMTSRFLRNNILAQMSRNYVRTAYAKGCSEHQVLYNHVLKNALIPVITFLGIVIADVVAGTVIIEMVFNVPGLGRLVINAITNRDYNVVQAGVLIIAAFVIIVNFVVDALYKLVDKRVQV